MSDGAPATLSVHESGRTLDPTEIVLGGIWLGPGGGDGGDGNRPDLGQENATAAVEAALRSGICEFDTAPWYGAGASEERLGRALQALTQRGLTVTRSASDSSSLTHADACASLASRSRSRSDSDSDSDTDSDSTPVASRTLLSLLAMLRRSQAS